MPGFRVDFLGGFDVYIGHGTLLYAGLPLENAAMGDSGVVRVVPRGVVGGG
jgi:hypothetical protein